MNNDKVKILVVDDSDIILNILKEYLSPYNVQVVTSRNGLEGIKKAIEVKPGIILLDLLMPNFDGIKMLQVIKLMEELSDIPVIVISGNTDKVNVLTAIEAGADRVLAKPVNREQLIESIEQLLGKQLPLNANASRISTIGNDDGLVYQLKKLFVENFRNEKQKLEKALAERNPHPLKQFAHKAKSVGGTIGYPQLQKINYEMEKMLNADGFDWQIIKIKFNQVESIIKDLENSISVW